MDTINRTYRNIDIAVDYQAEQVALLTSRLKKLKISSNQHPAHSSTRDSRLPDTKRQHHTASSRENAASALNSERSTHKLKAALLSVRPQPLLNTNAATASAAPLAFTTRQKPLVKGDLQHPGLDFDLEPSDSTAWNPAAFDESQSHDIGPRRRGGRNYGTSAKIKKTPNSSPSSANMQSPAPSFDWGPLPVVAPGKGLPFGFSKLPSSFK